MNKLNINKDVIAYTINKGISTDFYITVQNGEVLIEAPWYLSRNRIHELVERKKKWIMMKIKEYEESKDYIRRENVKILGEDCKVIINYKNLKKPQLIVEGKNIKVYLPNKYKSKNRDEILVLLIEKMYTMIAEEEIEHLMEKVRITLGFAPEDYIIKKMNNCLATCLDNKTILINPNIVKYSKEVIEYVILHEYCHLKYKTHGKRFYEMLQTYMPDYRKYEKEIEDYKI